MTKGGRRRIVVATVVIVATLGVVAPLGPSHAAHADPPAIPTPLSCSASSTLGVTAVSQQLGLVVTGAPAQSLPGKTFTLSIADPGETLPATLQGDPVTSEQSLQVVYPVPAGATFVSASLTGGTNVGTGATVAEVADAVSPGQTNVVETVPGPIAAGQTFSLPTLDLTLTASSTVGTVITTDLLDVPPAGSATASTDPAVSATLAVTQADNSSVDVTDVCWPTAPAPTTLSSTTVVSVDTTPPAISLTSPVSGAVYTVGQVVDAAYSCTDVASYGVASCTGPVASGAAIDTSQAGPGSFTVTATDANGTSAQQTVTYTVAVPTTVIGPTDAGTLPLVTGTSCAFGGPGCPVAAAPEATYQVTSPVADDGPLVIGDSLSVEWQVYEPGGYSAVGAGGPELSWTIPAPTGAVINGPVTTSATGLASPAAGLGSSTGAGACSDATCGSHTTAPGVLVVNGTGEQGTGWTYQAVNQSSLAMSWAEDSAPGVGTDGLYLDIRYSLTVTRPGTVTLPGFPALTSPTGLATAPLASPTPPVSFTVTDPLPPTATIATPVSGAVYNFGQVVDASYTCADPVVTVTSCTGSVADGAPIDTTSATPGGVHTFTVTATDSVGNTATAQASYQVAATPPVAAPESYSVSWGAAANLPVLGGDTATELPLDPTSVTIVTPPADGTATPNPDGSVTFVDNPSLTLVHASPTGTFDDSFTYQVRDADGDVSNTSTVTLTILPQLVLSPITPPLAGQLTLQQSQAQPVDPLGSTVGSLCSGMPLLLEGEAEDSCGQLAPVTITNAAGGSGGWSLTGQVGDFVDPSAPSTTTCDTPATYTELCIPGGDLGWSPTAAVNSVLPGSSAVVQPGATVSPAPITVAHPSLPGASYPLVWDLWPTVSAPGSTLTPPAGLHDAPQVLCQSTTTASGGSFSCGAGLILPVPASTAASSGPGFQATITLTLS